MKSVFRSPYIQDTDSSPLLIKERNEREKVPVCDSEEMKSSSNN